MAIDDLTLNVTTICNLALSHLGQKRLASGLATDLENNNPSAIAIDTHWTASRNDVFSEFKWPFATVIEPMQVQVDVNDTMYPEWLYFYVYTENAATVWNVFDPSTVEQKEEQEFEVVYRPALNKKVICCNITNTSSAFNEYTYNVTDTLLWSPKFIMAFSYRLAAAIAVTLTGSKEKALELMTIYNAFIHEAKRIAHVQKKKKPAQTAGIVNARGA